MSDVSTKTHNSGSTSADENSGDASGPRSRSEGGEWSGERIRGFRTGPNRGFQWDVLGRPGTVTSVGKPSPDSAPIWHERPDSPHYFTLDGFRRHAAVCRGCAACGYGPDADEFACTPDCRGPAHRHWRTEDGSGSGPEGGGPDKAGNFDESLRLRDSGPATRRGGGDGPDRVSYVREPVQKRRYGTGSAATSGPKPSSSPGPNRASSRGSEPQDAPPSGTGDIRGAGPDSGGGDALGYCDADGPHLYEDARKRIVTIRGGGDTGDGGGGQSG